MSRVLFLTSNLFFSFFKLQNYKTLVNFRLVVEFTFILESAHAHFLVQRLSTKVVVVVVGVVKEVGVVGAVR